MPTMMPLTTVPTDRPRSLARQRHDSGEGHELLRHATDDAQAEGRRDQRPDAGRNRRRRCKSEGKRDLDKYELAPVEAVAQRQQQGEPGREAEQRRASDQIDRRQADPQARCNQWQDRLGAIDVGDHRAGDDRHHDDFCARRQGGRSWTDGWGVQAAHGILLVISRPPAMAATCRGPESE
jgi:hypothetical protein